MGHRALTQEDTRPLAQSLNTLVGDAEIDMTKIIQGGDSVMDVETDWPDIRPRRAHSRNTVRFALGGQDQSIVEDHEYRFDWRAAAPGDLRCGPAK